MKHQRILGIPNLSATCGVRPLPALSVRYSRCPSATCAVKVQFAMSVRNLRYPSATGVASAGLVKTVTNTPLQKPSRTHAQEVYSSRFRACKNRHEHTSNFAPLSRKSGILSTFTDRLGAPILQNFADNQKGKGAKTRFLRARHQKCGLLLTDSGTPTSP